ncbi:MAG: ComEC/Rec2 family competence protein [Spirochaetaceae bacterium]|jgi:competence protein ComEC|nr:ComEC/Rec2 family competence protein [Spirochaetaceae bacterium]
MNNIQNFKAAFVGAKLPFFAFAGSLAAYYGFAPAYGGGNPAQVLLPAMLLLTTVLSLLCVLDSLRISGIDERCIKKMFIAGIFFTAGFALGIACRGAANYSYYLFPGLETDNIVAVSGKLIDDPRNTASGRGMALLNLNASHGKRGLRVSARGKVMVFFPEGSIPRLKEFGRGSEIYIEGNFIKTDASSHSKTPMFRARSVHVTHPPPRFEQWRTGIRLALIDVFSPGDATGRGRDWGGLALALLLGIRDNLDGELSEQYRNAGCSYILALSGMHLAIVSSIIAFFLKKPLGLKKAALIGMLFILLYVFLVGAQPSLTRAAIMYVLGAIAIICAFPVNPALLLGFSFIIQIFVQPDSGDTVSFILSYLALAGILSLGQGAAGLFRGYVPEFAGSSLSASLGAFLATMSVSIVFFGSLRPIGIAAGLVMVPLTTVFMIGAMAYLPLHLLAPQLTPLPALLLGRGLELVYRILERIVSFAGRFPNILFSNVIFSTIVLIVVPIIILYVCKIMHIKRLYLEKFA